MQGKTGEAGNSKDSAATKKDDEGQEVTVPTGNAIKSVKLLAQATGEFTRSELNKEAEFRWTKAASDLIQAAKDAADGGGGNGG